MSEFTDAPLVGTAGVFYKDPNEVRFEVALTTAEAFRDAGVPYVVVDASPRETGDWVAQAHRERGAIVLPAEIPGIATQRKQGVAYAVERGAEKVVGLEPEKPAVAAFADEIAQALDAYDVLVVGRTAAAEESLPPTQQRTERLAGWILERTHTLPPDALAGPRGFTRKGAKVLAEYPATEPGMNNWLYMYETPLAARRKEYNIGGIAIDMIYPDAAVEEESDNPTFDNKRFDQFTMQLKHLLGQGFDSSILRLGDRVMALHVRDAVEKIDDAEYSDKPVIFGRLEDLMTSRYGYEPADRLRVQ